MCTEISEEDTLNLVRDGAQRFRSAIEPAILQDIENAIAHLMPNQAGVRLHGIGTLRLLLTSPSPVAMVAASVLGEACRPVRAVLFDKTSTANWSLGWHQDRTIAVAERIDVDGFGPWSVKSGLVHVAPPFELLARMVTVRVHLDPVPATNAPLLIARGSHRLGRILVADVPDVVRRCSVLACLAGVGDIWLYATPILHASEAALEPARRRVLQVDFAAESLPGGLQWLGI
jgi:Phytanoyl-CoA dioxygenase (PhyH)